MSLHIDDPAKVDGVLISGCWIGVDPGTLQRVSERRSSISSEVSYRWTLAEHVYMATAGDIKAVRLASQS